VSIHRSAIIEKGAQLGEGVVVGPFTTIHAKVRIGDFSTIESHCVIGHENLHNSGAFLDIGPESLIRTHSVLYLGSKLGPYLETGH